MNASRRKKAVVVTEVIRFVVWKRRENQTDGVRGEILEPPPDHRRNVQSVIGAVQRNDFSVCTIVELDVEAPGERDQELLELAVRVTASGFPARDVVDPVDAPDRERDMPLTLDEGEIAACVHDFRKVQGPAGIDRQVHRVIS